MELCGKSCVSCAWKEQLNCPGCQEGPGRAIYGDCDVARCCRGKGHAACETCGFADSCQTRRNRFDLPQQRLAKRERETARQAKLAQDAPVLATWLWRLFWLLIAGQVAGLLDVEALKTAFPAAGLVGAWLNALVLLFCGAFLWKLAPVRQRYRTAALCQLALAALTILKLLTGLGDDGLGLLLNLVVIAVGLPGTYQKYNAHAEVLDGLDDVLAEKWRKLWKWTIGFMLGTAGCILVVLVSALLGLLAVLVCSIGLLVVGIVELVYLYRTAQVFRNYHVEALPEACE